MNSPTPEQVAAYATDPMAYFADSIIPAGDGDSRLGDVWADFQIEAFRVLADCMLAVAAGRKPPYRGLWIERTKGASKDSDVGLALMWLLLFSVRPQTIELGADDLDQILETYKAMKDDLRLNPWKASRVTAFRRKISNTETGSECLFLACDDSGSHGSRPSVTVCNELSHVGNDTFTQTMMDNADKISRNLVIIATNAGELATWQHKWREDYRTDPDWWFQKVDIVAPWIDPKNVAGAKRRNPPGRFARLWEGIWGTPGGDAIPATSIERAIKHDAPMTWRPPEWHAGGIGVDLGLVSHHASLVVVLGCYEQQAVRVALVRDFPPPVDLEDVYQGILSAGQQFGVRFLAYDTWEMARLSQQLAGRGFDIEPCRPTPRILTRQSATMREVFREGTIELYHGGDADLLIEDMYSTRVIIKSYGERLDWPENEHGHCDRAAAMANILPHVAAGMAEAPESQEEYWDGMPVAGGDANLLDMIGMQSGYEERLSALHTGGTR